MNTNAERAREACDACRKSHKKCTYDGNSTSCKRCEERGKPCSLFLSVETPPAVGYPAPSVVAATEPAPGSWADTPHDISATSSHSHFPPYQLPQAEYYWPTDCTAETAPYPANTVFQPYAPVDQHENEQPFTNEQGLYHNVSGDHHA